MNDFNKDIAVASNGKEASDVEILNKKIVLYLKEVPIACPGAIASHLGISVNTVTKLLRPNGFPKAWTFIECFGGKNVADKRTHNQKPLLASGFGLKLFVLLNDLFLIEVGFVNHLFQNLLLFFRCLAEECRKIIL